MRNRLRASAALAPFSQFRGVASASSYSIPVRRSSASARKEALPTPGGFAVQRIGSDLLVPQATAASCQEAPMRPPAAMGIIPPQAFHATGRGFRFSRRVFPRFRRT